jgi:hypothetical protein
VNSVYGLVDDDASLEDRRLAGGDGNISGNLRSEDRDDHKPYKDGTGPQTNEKRRR